MAPVKVRIECLDCGREFKGYQLSTTKKAQNHANYTGHVLEAWQLPGGYLYSIMSHRPRNTSREPGY
jgi:hypothetical protein